MRLWRGERAAKGARFEHIAASMGLVLLAATACDPDEDGSETSVADTGTDSETQGSSSAGSDGSTGAGTSSTTGPGTSTTSTTNASGGSSGNDSDTQSTNPTTDSGGFMPISCALEDLDPTAVAADVLDYGDGEGQIPTLIGEALLRNCGCHYTDNVIVVVDYTFDNAQQLSNLADFQNNFLGTLPFDFNDRPTYEAVEQRVIFEDPLPMPTFECASPGTEPPVTITEEDKALFQAWFDADASDGATFTYT